MKEKTEKGLDFFRIIAAILVITIHTSPLESYSAYGDFLLTRVVARIAVPFFLMLTGYFLVPQMEKGDAKPMLRYLKKTSLLYITAIAVYLPICIYTGYFSKNFTMLQLAKDLFTGEIFYHLWYLPASMLGMLVVFLLLRYGKDKVALWGSIFLYLVGLFGDSYYGVIKGIPFLEKLYEGIFWIFSYSRCGLFYVPVFLMLGYWVSKRKTVSYTGLVCSVIGLLVEGSILYAFSVQRHDSMYFGLLPVMYYLFGILQNNKGRSQPKRRTFSLAIYLLHPLVIVLVHKLISNKNSLLYFGCVTIVTIILAYFVVYIKAYYKGYCDRRNKCGTKAAEEERR